MKQLLVEQSQAGRLQLAERWLTDGSKVYDVLVSGVTIACASQHDADKLFALLDNTAYDVLPGSGGSTDIETAGELRRAKYSSAYSYPY